MVLYLRYCYTSILHYAIRLSKDLYKILINQALFQFTQKVICYYLFIYLLFPIITLKVVCDYIIYDYPESSTLLFENSSMFK